MAPVVLGLLSSPAQSVLTSSARLGRISQGRRLFLTVDDTARAPELTALAQSRGGVVEPGRGRPQPAWIAEEVPASST
jgi:membrane glycosyltransferase